jgi:choline-sulfatase
MGKQNMYDCSTRMPLLIAGPGVARGSRVDALVYQHSMFATTCELAGVPVPKSVEFPSLVPLLQGKKVLLHDAVFCYYLNYQRSVRTSRYKLIVYPQIHRAQLFDLTEDPWEIHDRADDPALASVKQELITRLSKYQAELGDTLNLSLS